MSRLGFLGIILVVVTLVLVAQTAPSGQITIKPLGPSSSCVADSAGDVLCAATDGFYISIAGGAFQKIGTGTAPPPASPTRITCTTASLSSGSTGNLNASGCTFQ